MNQPRNRTQSGLSRRTFIRGTATAIAGFTIVPRHVLGGAGFVPPSEKVNIAIVGCGGQGRTNVRALFQETDAQSAIFAARQRPKLSVLRSAFPSAPRGRIVHHQPVLCPRADHIVKVLLALGIRGPKLRVRNHAVEL